MRIISYQCDQCESIKDGRPTIELTGNVWDYKDTFFPLGLQEKEFCSKECFWTWCQIKMPKKFLVQEE